MTLPKIRVDLISDTATHPSLAMRHAMANAAVGDEQLDEDPSVNALNQKVAQLLGKPAALFLPSGTMANQIALAVHCNRGDAIIAAHNAHIVGSEGAGAAVFAGAVIQGLPTADGIFDTDLLRQSLKPHKLKSPKPKVIEIEQTHNRGGGSVWPLATLRSVSDFAKEHQLIMHMDGARLMNAVVASGVSAREYVELCDSAWIDLSKGLGCPIGSVLVGSEAFIAQANIWKHRFGGAMRQAGIVAAAGIYALDHHIEDLAHDHRRAQEFAAFLAEQKGIELTYQQIQTNLVFFNIQNTGHSATDIANRLRDRGVRIGVESDNVMRAVFHRDIDDHGLQLAMSAMKLALTA